MARFVVLFHQTSGSQSRGDHWDLMFQSGTVLRTWALVGEPRLGRAIDARALPDHRLRYLDYEGPVGGDRGRVTRWDAGEYSINAENEGRLEATLAGERLKCRISLVRNDASPDDWQVRFYND